MSSEIAIKVESLSKCYQIYERPQDRLKQMLSRGRKQYYKEFWALKDVSFEVKKGETVGIIGRNGSGKSTLLQMICGTLNPTSGIVQTQGRIAALLELGSGFNPEFSGRENVFLNASVLGLTDQQIQARFTDIETFADIGQFIDQPVKTYSSGMMLRLAFAVIAHVDADILIIDEALAVGDAFFTQKCMRFLRSFMLNNTVLFVSHDTGSVKSLCNQAVWIEKGNMLLWGSPKDVTEQYLEAFYEAQQGKSTRVTLKPNYDAHTELQKKDQRLEFLNQTNLRNDLEIFDFNPNANSFGKGGATIIDVHLLDAKGNALNWVVGGEFVRIQVTAQAHTLLQQPIVGFYLKDRLGQNLFGDNTYLTYMADPVAIKENEQLTAEFSFHIPILAKGDYSICVAIANGTQALHEQHHWIHDAVMFKCDSTSVASGLIGIPMANISLNKATVRQKINL